MGGSRQTLSSLQLNDAELSIKLRQDLVILISLIQDANQLGEGIDESCRKQTLRSETNHISWENSQSSN